MRRAVGRQRDTPSRSAGAVPPTCAARCGRGRPADAWHSQRDGGREPLPPHAPAARILPVWPASDGAHRGGSDHRGRRRGLRTLPPHVAAMRSRPTTRGTSMGLPPRGCARHDDGGGAAPPSPARASFPPSPTAAAAAATAGREEDFWGPMPRQPRRPGSDDRPAGELGVGGGQTEGGWCSCQGVGGRRGGRAGGAPTSRPAQRAQLVCREPGWGRSFNEDTLAGPCSAWVREEPRWRATTPATH